MLFEVEGTSGNRKGKFVIAGSGDGVGSGGGGNYGGGGGDWDAWGSEGCVRQRGRWGLRLR